MMQKMLIPGLLCLATFGLHATPCCINLVDSPTLWPKIGPGTEVDSAFPGLPKYGNGKPTEAKVKGNKKIWRCLDTRQLKNVVFTTGSKPFTQYIFELAGSGKIKVYNNDGFDSAISTSEQSARMTQTVHTQVFSPNGQSPAELKDTSYEMKVNWRNVSKWYIAEEHVFNAHSGEVVPVITGLAPVFAFSDDGGKDGPATDKELYWIKMEDLYPYLVSRKVTDRAGQVLELNWYDLLNKHRLFDAYVVKESNADDAFGLGAGTALEILLNAESIRNDLFIFEHDLWEY